MALLKKTQRSFSGGQLDKDLSGRQDLQKYSQGALVLENFKVRKQGNIIKRPGTNLVADFTRILDTVVTEDGEESVVSGTVATAKLIPIVFEREIGYYMLLSGGKAFLVGQNGVKMSNGSWSKEPSASLSVGGQDPVVPYSIDIPVADADLKMLDHCQSGDTIFFAHRSYPPFKIVYSAGTLEYERLQFRQELGNPPSISSVTLEGDKWTGTGGEVELEYAVTAVKDGVETGKSVPYAIQYNAPWDSSSSIKITIDSSSIDADDFDTFYIYKKISDVFGLVGTTSNQKSFVDISDGFSVSGTLFPTGFTTFDQAVHLREKGNKFASVHSVNSYYHFIANATYKGYGGTQTAVTNTGVQPIPAEGYYVASSTKGFCSAIFIAYSYVYTITSASKSCSIAAEFTFNNIAFNEFHVRIGCLHHVIKDLQYYEESCHSTDGSLAWDRDSLIRWTKYSANYSDFYASPAKFYTATVEFYNTATSAWVTSNQFDCTAAVDQTNPGSGWEAVAGAANQWRKTYDDDDYIISYDSAADVVTRMDAYAPSVGAEVKFEIPETQTIGGTTYTLAGKQIRKITVYGWTDSTKTTAADMIVNGIACYHGGKYVYTFTDDNITPDLTITPPKTEDHFVNPGEYPGCVQIYQQRLCYAASADSPFTFWMSCTGDLYNFDSHEYVRASDAITASTAALEMPRINRMLVHRDLMMFSDGGEWQVAPTSGNAVAPSTISAKLQSVIGSAAWLKPIALDMDILYCDRSGENIYATRYNFASDGYESSNLTVLSQRLFRNNRIEAMVFAQFPEATLECVLADGRIASLVYMKEHDVCAWSIHTLGGDWKAFDVAVNKSLVDGSSEVNFLCKRSYQVENDGTSSTITEFAVLGLRDIDPNDSSLLHNLRMDAVRSVTNARVDGEAQPPTAGHGETVVKIGETRTGSGELITVTHDTYAVGCCFTSTLKTTSPEFTDQETAQMEIKGATEAEVRVIDGSDFTVRQTGVSADKATVMKVDCEIDEYDSSFTCSPGDADVLLPLTGNNSRNGSIILEHSGFLPLSVLSVSTAYRVEYANHANGGSQNGN